MKQKSFFIYLIRNEKISWRHVYWLITWNLLCCATTRYFVLNGFVFAYLYLKVIYSIIANTVQSLTYSDEVCRIGSVDLVAQLLYKVNNARILLGKLTMSDSDICREQSFFFIKSMMNLFMIFFLSMLAILIHVIATKSIFLFSFLLNVHTNEIFQLIVFEVVNYVIHFYFTIHSRNTFLKY